MGSSRLGLAPPPLRLFSILSARASQALAISRRASLCLESLILPPISMQSCARRRCARTSSVSFIPSRSLRTLRDNSLRAETVPRRAGVFLYLASRSTGAPVGIGLPQRPGPLLIRGEHPIFIGNVLKGFPDTFRDGGVGLALAFGCAFSVHIPV